VLFHKLIVVVWSRQDCQQEVIAVLRQQVEELQKEKDATQQEKNALQITYDTITKIIKPPVKVHVETQTNVTFREQEQQNRSQQNQGSSQLSQALQSGSSPARHSIQQQPQQPQMQTLPRQIVEGRGNQRSPAAPAQRSPAAPAPLQQNTGPPQNQITEVRIQAQQQMQVQRPQAPPPAYQNIAPRGGRGVGLAGHAQILTVPRVPGGTAYGVAPQPLQHVPVQQVLQRPAGPMVTNYIASQAVGSPVLISSATAAPVANVRPQLVQIQQPAAAAARIQVRNTQELIALPKITEWFKMRLQIYSEEDIIYMNQQAQTWLDDLQEANKDDFSFDELFDELSSDEQYHQYQNDENKKKLLRMALNKVYYTKWQIAPDYETYRAEFLNRHASGTYHQMP